MEEKYHERAQVCLPSWTVVIASVILFPKSSLVLLEYFDPVYVIF